MHVFSTFKLHLFAWLVFVSLPTCATALFADASSTWLAFCSFPSGTMALVAMWVDNFVIASEHIDSFGLQGIDNI